MIETLPREEQWSPQMEELRGQLKIAQQASVMTADLLADKRNKTVDKSIAKVALRRPKAEDLYEIREESGSATFAAKVAKDLVLIAKNAPKDAEGGFAIRLAGQKYVGRSGKSQSVAQTLEVRRGQDGTEFKIIKESGGQTKPFESSYFLSDGGGLYGEHGRSGKSTPRYRMRGTFEEGLSRANRDREYEAGGGKLPSNYDDYLYFEGIGESETLNNDLDAFKKAVDESRYGQYRDSGMLLGMNIDNLEITALEPEPDTQAFI